MNSTYIIGIDLGKHIFHLVGHDYAGRERLFERGYPDKKTLQLLSVHEPVIVCDGSMWWFAIGLPESVKNMGIKLSSFRLNMLSHM